MEMHHNRKCWQTQLKSPSVPMTIFGVEITNEDIKHQLHVIFGISDASLNVMFNPKDKMSVENAVWMLKTVGQLLTVSIASQA